MRQTALTMALAALLTTATAQAQDISHWPDPKKNSPEKIEQNIFFAENSTAVDERQALKVGYVAQWAAENPSATIVLTGYADAATGRKRQNMAISERRAMAVKKALVSLGVDERRIVVDQKGALVQPFANNDDNRVVVMRAEAN